MEVLFAIDYCETEKHNRDIQENCFFLCRNWYDST